MGEHTDLYTMGALSKALIIVASACAGLLYAVVDENNRQAIQQKFQIMQDELITESKPKVDLVVTGDVPPTALVREAEKSQALDLPASRRHLRKPRDLGHDYSYYYYDWDYDYSSYDYDWDYHYHY